LWIFHFSQFCSLKIFLTTIHPPLSFRRPTPTTPSSPLVVPSIHVPAKHHLTSFLYAHLSRVRCHLLPLCHAHCAAVPPCPPLRPFRTCVDTRARPHTATWVLAPIIRGHFLHDHGKWRASAARATLRCIRPIWSKWRLYTSKSIIYPPNLLKSTIFTPIY